MNFKFLSIFHRKNLGARVDVTIAYAFIRVSDDLVDDGQLNMKQRLVNHKIILKFMDQLFSSRNEKWTYDVGQPIDSANKPPVNWEYYKSNLPLEAYQVLKAYARTVYYQPSGPMKDLVSTYSWDLEEKHIANEKELIEFARCAGGGIMAAFHCIQLYKSGLYPNGISPLERPFIDTFYAIGQVSFYQFFISLTLLLSNLFSHLIFRQCNWLILLVILSMIVQPMEDVIYLQCSWKILKKKLTC